MELKFKGKPEDLAGEANIFDKMDKDDVQKIANTVKTATTRMFKAVKSGNAGTPRP